MSSQGISDRTGGNGQAGAEDVLYALSDEQILEMDGEVESGEAQLLDGARRDFSAPAAAAASARNDDVLDRAAGNDALRDEVKGNEAAGNTSAVNDAARKDGVEPPEWLARMMEDPQAGGEAQEFWEGILRARSEGAAYRAAIATPEEARALKELYPGGVNEARAAAERARQLEQIDRVYFGAAGMRPEEAASARAQLAQTLLREDPAAFREMVAAGVKALEEANAAPPGIHPGHAGRPAEPAPQTNSGLPARAGQVSPGGAPAGQASQRASELAPEGTSGAAREAQLAAYSAFEKTANEELERGVGGAITRALQQALPSLHNSDEKAAGGARSSVPLQERLGSLIREDVEAALKGDRQLGEQVAQILASRRFDDATRAQVVRLIGERARQLVAGSARRVLNEWTQMALAAHRARTGRGESVSARDDQAPAAGEREIPGMRSGENRPERAGTGRDSGRNDKERVRSSTIDYRKLSDEQILDL